MASEEKLQTGRVVGNKMDKTVVVRIDRHKRHRLYGKTMSVTRRYKAHDEKNECRLGDIVKIAETRPLSREKRWRVVEVVTKGDVAEVAPRDIGAHIIEDTMAAAKAEEEARAAAAAAAAPMEEPVADEATAVSVEEPAADEARAVLAEEPAADEAPAAPAEEPAADEVAAAMGEEPDDDEVAP
jgi:small subunit ribosomal protein S17